MNNKINNKLKLMIFVSFIIFVFSLNSYIFADATIKSTLISGNPWLASEQLVILVQVSSNDTGTTPIACAFRVEYNSNCVNYTSLTEKDMGQVPYISIEKGTPPNVYRDFSTLGDSSKTALTKDCFEIKFTTVATPPVNHSIIFSDDPKSSAPLVSIDFINNIPHTFDNSGTTDLAVGAAVNDWMLLK